MKSKYTSIFIGAFLFLLCFSCKPKETSKEISAGEVNSERYVSIGGAITAGFMDDAIYSEGQENSLGAILAKQFELIGGGVFNQPLMPSNSVGCNALFKARNILAYKTDCLNVSSLSPVRISAQGDIVSFQTNVYSASSLFNNFGTPYLKVTEFDLPGIGNPLNGPGNFNAYFARMASNQSSATIKGDILAKNPTFFTFFSGIDEVIEFAKGGAASGSLTPVNGSVGIGFSGSVYELLNSLTANGARGVISNIPDVTEFPYFTTIPYDGLNLDAEKAETLNEIYNPIGIYFQVGKNAFVIEDPSAGAFGVRKMVPGEKIVLSVPLDSVKCFKMGSVYPFRNEFILTLDELTDIRSTINSYNSILSNYASANNLAFVDAYTFFSELNSGIVYNGITLNAKFVSGGAFSLDGLTLNPRGNALLANKFISSMNITYKSTLPSVDVTKYRGVVFP